MRRLNFQLTGKKMPQEEIFLLTQFIQMLMGIYLIPLMVKKI